MTEIQSEENALLGDSVELSLYNQDGQVQALLLFDAVLGDQGHMCSLSSIKHYYVVRGCILLIFVSCVLYRAPHDGPQARRAENSSCSNPSPTPCTGSCDQTPKGSHLKEERLAWLRV